MRALLILTVVAGGCDRGSTAQFASTPPAPTVIEQPKPGEPGEVIPEPNRPLTAGERAMLKPIFRNGIDYDVVRVINASFPFQPKGVYMTPRGHVYAPGPLWRDDFSLPGLRGIERAVFVHEMTHVWQHANGMDLVAQGVLEFTKYRGDYERAYPYQLQLGADLMDYGMEQQASIIEDYYLITFDHSTPFRMENRGLTATQRDQLFAGVMKRFLEDAKYVRSMSAEEIAKRHAVSSEKVKPGPAACKESESEHGTSHMCAWRYEPPKK